MRLFNLFKREPVKYQYRTIRCGETWETRKVSEAQQEGWERSGNTLYSDNNVGGFTCRIPMKRKSTT